MKSSRCSDEIVRFAHGEMKSVLDTPRIAIRDSPGTPSSPARQCGFHRAAISPAEGGFHPSEGRISLKKALLSGRQKRFFLVGEGVFEDDPERRIRYILWYKVHIIEVNHKI